MVNCILNKKLLLIATLLSCICNSFANNGDTFKANIDGVEVQFKVTDESAKEVQVGTNNGKCVDVSTTGILNIPSSVNGYTVTSIGEMAFYYCEAIDEVKIPNTIKTIQAYAFYNCGINTINLPDGLTEIHNDAFTLCSKLKKIRLPKNVTLIQQNAFDRAAIEEITIGCKSVLKMWSDNLTNVKKMTIESTVENVEEGAFKNLRLLNTLHVNSEKVGRWFGIDNIQSLTTLSFGDNVKEIQKGAFVGATGITTLALPLSLECIGEEAFEGCTNITALVIPSSVHTIGYYAFCGCSSLSAISVKSGNSKYDSRDNCNAIIETATNTLFLGCSSTTIPNTVVKIGISAFAGSTCPSTLTVPTSVTEICENAFGNCSDLKHIEIPQSVTRIGMGAFTHSGLEEIRIPESVNNIEDDILSDCLSLKTVILPSSVQQIGHYVFNGSPVEFLVVLAEQPVSLAQDAISYNSRPYLFVPQNSISLYKNAATWSSCKAVYPINHIVYKNSTKEYGSDINIDDIKWDFDYADDSNLWWMDGIAIELDADKYSPVGEYPIKVSHSNEYAIARQEFCVTEDAVLTITQAPLTVSTDDITIKQGEEIPTFKINYSGFKNGEDESVLTSKPTATTTATSQSPIGEYAITLSGGDAQNYKFSYVSGKLTIVDSSSGISTITSSSPSTKIIVFDIRGNKIPSGAKLYNGVYIIDGKKVIIK